MNDDIAQASCDFASAITAFEASPCFLTLRRMIVAQERYLKVLGDFPGAKEWYRNHALEQYRALKGAA